MTKIILGWVKSFAIFWYMQILVCISHDHAVQVVDGSIVVGGTLTHCALLHSLCDLQTVQINVQQHLIWDFMLYKFKLGAILPWK